MHALTTSWLLLLAGLCGPHPPSAQAEWTWIVGELQLAEEQARYEDYARRMFDFYQSRDIYSGRLIREAELEDVPAGPVVFMGPVDAFRRREWLAPLVAVEGADLILGERKLTAARTGVYVRNQAGTRIAFTGLSLEGFEDIFRTRTGTRACTVTVAGRPRFKGDYGPTGLELRALPFRPTLPRLEDLAHLAPFAAAVETTAVYADEASEVLSPDFEACLAALIEDQRVLFIGEQHWNVGVNRLFNRILAALLAREAVTSVFLEINYSFSAHYDHYASLDDDAEARRFLQAELHPLVQAETTLETLEILRRWNRAHPERRVHVAGLDLEFGTQQVFERVLVSFFQSIQPDFRVAPFLLRSKEGIRLQVTNLRRLLAESEPPVDSHPFLSAAFVANVLQNIEDSLAAGGPGPARQAAIARNVTQFHGPLFAAERLDQGLVLFKGGGFHAVKEPRATAGGWPEAAHLNQRFPPTKGRVATLMLAGMGYGFGNVRGLDLSQRLRTADNYHDFVDAYREGLTYGGAVVGEFYLLDDRELSLVEQLVLRSGDAQEANVLLLDRVRPELLQPTFGANASTHCGQDYDATVFVMRAQLERTRPLELERR